MEAAAGNHCKGMIARLEVKHLLGIARAESY
jgi:hypothetical protein